MIRSKLIPILFGCLCAGIFMVGFRWSSYTYKYRFMDDERFEEFYLTKAVYSADRVELYWDGTMEDWEDIELEEGATMDEEKITITTDEPLQVTTLFLSAGEYEYDFRRLNTRRYCCLRYSYDTAGGQHIEGDTERFYTKEEKAQQQAEVRRAKRKKLAYNDIFDQFLGEWYSKDGQRISLYTEVDDGRGINIKDQICYSMISIEEVELYEPMFDDAGYLLVLDVGTCGMCYDVTFDVEGDKMMTDFTGDTVFYRETYE